MLAIEKHKYGALYSAIFGLSLLLAAPAPARATIDADQSSAVIFVYQRIGEDTQPQSSISVEQFKEHIKELQTGGYHVLPLDKIIDAIKNGETLPQKTVGLTFEGAWLSTYANALPLLDDADLPFTVFFSTDMAEDGGNPAHMTWKHLRDLQKDSRATLALMPSAYVHMAEQTKDQNAAIINKALTRFKDELGKTPVFFAYPYGEYSAELKKQMEGYAFKAVFGEQSGVVHAKSDFEALPRFTMTDNYGDLERFQLTANALPLPVTDIIPDDMVLKQNPPLLGFTVSPDLKDLSKLSCFVSGQGKADVIRLGGGRVELRIKDKFDDSRTRINCTMPDSTVIPGQPQSWRWFGMQLITPGFVDDSTTAAPEAEAPANDDTQDTSPGEE
ncbi:MAG: polysaccharide deacetylase family protein [Micavibrio sp.]|nr:polysaccharide deacetylase family protein [Micavibrio sp.]